MKTRPFAFALSIALASALLPASSPVVAQNEKAANSCEQSKDNAAMTLPSPLNRFAQVFCTSRGQVITGHDGWMWVQPESQGLVIIPSTNVEAKPEPAALSKAYFTKIDVKKITGEEYDRAMGNFRTAAFGRNDGKPAGYRLDVTTAGGEALELYFFDYFTYGWGISCPGGQCDLSSRFIIFNVNHEPQKLQAPI